MDKEIKEDSKFKLDDNAIFELSVVDNPASQAKGLRFSATTKDNTEKQDKMTFNVMDADTTKHTVSGVFFPADKEIERYNEYGTRYWVSMTKEAVFSMFEKYLRQGGSYITVEHNDSECRYFPIVEAWIIDDESTKSPIYKHSLQDLGLDLATAPIGTAMISIYINDIEFWEKYILNGKFSFSIGGYFTLTPDDTVTDSPVTNNEGIDFSIQIREDFNKRVIESNEYKSERAFSSAYIYSDDNGEVTAIVKHSFNGKSYDLKIHEGWLIGFSESENTSEEINEIEPALNEEEVVVNTEEVTVTIEEAEKEVEAVEEDEEIVTRRTKSHLESFGKSLDKNNKPSFDYARYGLITK